MYRSVGELADHIHLSVRIRGLRYIKTALKLGGINPLSELKGGIDESSLKGFSVGHQITIALAKAKPVLLLKTLEQNRGY